MAKFLTYEEMSKKVAEKALDEFLYNGKSIREWMQIIASEDAISRKAVISTIYDSKPDFKNDFAQRFFADKVRALPPVTPQQRTGWWIDDEFGSKCSCCGVHTHLDKFNRPMKFKYCSMCGAKMEVKECEEK